MSVCDRKRSLRKPWLRIRLLILFLRSLTPISETVRILTIRYWRNRARRQRTEKETLTGRPAAFQLVIYSKFMKETTLVSWNMNLKTVIFSSNTTTLFYSGMSMRFLLKRLQSGHHYKNFKVRYNAVKIMLVTRDHSHQPRRDQPNDFDRVLYKLCNSYWIPCNRNSLHCNIPYFKLFVMIWIWSLQKETQIHSSIK